MSDIEVLKEKVESLKEKMDCLEEKVNEHRRERREDVSRLYDDTKKLREQSMDTISELKTAFGEFREELFTKMNGILVKTLIAVFTVFGATIISLVIWIWSAQIKP